MDPINRSLVIVIPKQAFIDWFNEIILSGEEEVISLEEAQEDCNAYLIPDYESPEECLEYIKGRKEALIKIELEDWVDNQSLWPKVLNLELFDEWFDVLYQSTVWDLAE